MDNAMLENAGFELVQDEDVRWEIRKNKGKDADVFAQRCALILLRTEEVAVENQVILECKEDYSKPVFYIDKNSWELTDEEFEDVVKNLLW